MNVLSLIWEDIGYRWIRMNMINFLLEGINASC